MTSARPNRSVATSGITRFLEPFTIAGYVVMAAAGLSVLNVFVLGLVQRKRERAALRAIGMTAGLGSGATTSGGSAKCMYLGIVYSSTGTGLDPAARLGVLRPGHRTWWTSRLPTGR